MFRTYCRAALRNLLRNKTYSLVNIVGLAVGLATVLVIFLIVQFEYSFDNFHKNKDRIYRLVSVPYKEGTGFNATAAVPLPVAAGLRIDYPQIEKVASIFGRDAQITIEEGKEQEEKKFNETRSIYFAEPSFFDIFSFEWLAGDPKTALNDPNSVVLTREIAEKYFGDWRSAIGKTIKYDNKEIYQIKGILENPPVNTDFPLKIVISYRSLKNVDLNDWVGTYGRGYCFALLPPGSDPAKFNLSLHDFVKRHKPADHINDGIILQPLADIHFNPVFGNFNGRTFSKKIIGTLSLVALFLIIIASVNFINLATVQMINRSKEIGVRKVLGSGRAQLVVQFIGETALITVCAVLLALGLATLALPFLNDLLQTEISINFSDLRTILFLIILTISVTLLAGFYPAVISSGFRPIEALKNKLSAGWMRGIIEKSVGSFAILHRPGFIYLCIDYGEPDELFLQCSSWL